MVDTFAALKVVFREIVQQLFWLNTNFNEKWLKILWIQITDWNIYIF